MIAQIIEVLDAVAGNRLGAPARHGLVELQNVEGGTAPAKYLGEGNWTIISIDQGGDWSYWRLTEKIKEKNAGFDACNGLITADHHLRLVTLVSRGLCDPVADVSRAAASDMRVASREVRIATGASIADIIVQGVDVDSSRVYAGEFKGAGFGTIGPDKALVAIDLIVRITGKEACFNVCGEPLDLTCALIEKASNAKVEECLGEERLAEICDGGAACLLTVNVTVDGVLEETLSDVDPCEENNVTINIIYS